MLNNWKTSSLHSFLCLTISLIMFISCKKEDDLLDDKKIAMALEEINRYCPNRTEFHFAGIVFGKEKCFNENINNYRQNDGFTFFNNKSSVNFGMTTVPAQIKDEHISVYSPGIDGVNYITAVKMREMFSPGEKQLASPDRAKAFPGFGVKFFEITGRNPDFGNPEGNHYYSNQGNQDSSSIKVIEINELTSLAHGEYRYWKISILINCKLYDGNGVFKGEIKNGLLTGRVQSFK